MPMFNGSYADYSDPGLWHRMRFWGPEHLRNAWGRLRLDPRDNGGGFTLHREWGAWTMRPVTGWRSVRWITPPPHSIRSIPGDDRTAAIDWGVKALGLA